MVLDTSAHIKKKCKPVGYGKQKKEIHKSRMKVL